MNVRAKTASSEIATRDEREAKLLLAIKDVEEHRAFAAQYEQEALAARKPYEDVYQERRRVREGVESMLLQARVEHARYVAIDNAKKYAETIITHLEENAAGLVSELFPHMQSTPGIRVIPSWEDRWNVERRDTISTASLIAEVSDLERGGAISILTFVIEQRVGISNEELQLLVYDGKIDYGTYDCEGSRRFKPAANGGYTRCHVVSILSYSSRDWNQTPPPKGPMTWKDMIAMRDLNVWQGAARRYVHRRAALVDARTDNALTPMMEQLKLYVRLQLNRLSEESQERDTHGVGAAKAAILRASTWMRNMSGLFRNASHG
jgi:hypothetical protein